MDKDSTGAGPRRHRLGPASGSLKAASEVAELQRSWSVGGLPQKGTPTQVPKLSTAAPELAEPGKHLRGTAAERGCQAPLEDSEQNKDQAEEAPEMPEAEEGPEEAPGRRDQEPEPETTTTRLQEGEARMVRAPAQKLSVFVEVDLGDHTEEAATGTTKEEKLAPADLGDLSGDESRCVCCIPRTARRKTKECV